MKAAGERRRAGGESVAAEEIHLSNLITALEGLKMDLTALRSGFNPAANRPPRLKATLRD
jgi:hypothetical protein